MTIDTSVQPDSCACQVPGSLLSLRAMIAAGLLLLLLSSTPDAPPSRDISLTLEAATEIALTHANDMIQAREDVLLVDADYATALSTVLPRLDLSMGGGLFYQRSRILETRNVSNVANLPNEQPNVVFGDFQDFDSSSFLNPRLSLSFTGRQLIYDGGRWWRALRQARDNKASRKADLRGIENLVRARVARAFYGLERARQARKNIAAQVAVDKAQVDRARKLLEVGRGAPNDLAIALRNLASDQGELLTADIAVGQAERALNVTMGRRPVGSPVLIMPARISSSTVTPRFVPASERLLVLARSHRPELISARATLRVAATQVDIARADYWPVLALEASYNRSSRRPDRLFWNPGENFTATVDFVLQWNLFQGLATDTEVERAQIQHRKQRAAYDELERQMISEVQDGLQRLRNLERASGYAEEQIAAAQEAVRLARGLYEAGRGTSLELRDAELGLTRARIIAINARLDAEVAYADLIRAVGTGQWETNPATASAETPN